MSRINVLWVIDHVCYDGRLHGGGRLYWNVLPRFDADRFHIVPCMLRASAVIRKVFANSPAPVSLLNKGKFDPTTLWTFLRLIKEQNIHVMHLHCYGASTFGRIAGVISGVPTIIHDYDTEVYFPYPSYLGIADRLLASMTRGAVAASPAVREFLVQKRKIERSKIALMLHAIPPEKYTPSPKQRVAKVREHLGIDGRAPIVGTVTKLGPQRGNEYLLKAAAEVLKTFPNAVFLLIYKPTRFHRLPDPRYVQASHADADGMVTEVDALVTELGIANNVRLIEWPEDIDDYVSACDLIVAPFLSQRFSSVDLLEAMAMGKPVIATDIEMAEQREIIENGVNGYLVSPGVVPELADRILRLLAHPDELAEMSRQARLGVERHSVDAYVQTLQSWYAELSASRAKPERLGD